jgi:hypothetical protein
MSIRDDFAYILSNYPAAKKQPSIRLQVNSAFLSLEKKVQNLNAVRKFNDILVTSFLGIGDVANVPWLAFLDKRVASSIQTGIHCVFLFRADMSGLYLTLNQGIKKTASRAPTYPRTFQDFKRDASKLREDMVRLSDRGFNFGLGIELRDKESTGKAHEKSTILYKFYDAKALPLDDEIEEDLLALLNVYNHYVEEEKTIHLHANGDSVT